MSQYGAFISAAESTSAVTKEVAAIREHVRLLHQARRHARAPCPCLWHSHATLAPSPPARRQSLPTLAGSCNSFAQAAERISASRAHNRHLLQHHGHVPHACKHPVL